MQLDRFKAITSNVDASAMSALQVEHRILGTQVMPYPTLSSQVCHISHSLSQPASWSRKSRAQIRATETAKCVACCVVQHSSAMYPAYVSGKHGCLITETEHGLQGMMQQASAQTANGHAR